MRLYGALGVQRTGADRQGPGDGDAGLESMRTRPSMLTRRIPVSQAATPAMTLLHLYADDNGDTHFGPTEITLALQDFARPVTLFNASDGQPATQFAIIKPPVGWVGEPHTSPKPHVLFCLTGSLKITCSTGETAVIEAGIAHDIRHHDCR